MSIADGKRLDPEVFKLDYGRMRKGWYSDEYFNNVVKVLKQLSDSGYCFKGTCSELASNGTELGKVHTGDMVVEIQIFTKRAPFSVVAGTDNAIAMLKKCAGYLDEKGEFISTFNNLEVSAVQDGTKVEPWIPAMKIRGRYRDFGILETPILGAISRRTRIATNVYQTLKAAGGKPVLFFPARFDIHETQPGDGYAYRVAIEAYNQYAQTNLVPYISTNSQGDWWGEQGGGTVSHSYVLCFLKDTAEAMIGFAEIMPIDINRIVLVDTNNDCVADSLATAQVMFKRYIECLESGDKERAKKYVLFAVRLDTAGNMVDKSIDAIGDPKVDCGVCPRLVWNVRRALDRGYEALDLDEKWLDTAGKYFESIKIVVSGGFDPERITLFESLKVPADIYGVGSYLMRGENNDFTADVVRVKINGNWRDLAKEGRRALENKDLEIIE
jgi:nicotinate phosphoribosyltransferase